MLLSLLRLASWLRERLRASTFSSNLSARLKRRDCDDSCELAKLAPLRLRRFAGFGEFFSEGSGLRRGQTEHLERLL